MILAAPTTAILQSLLRSACMATCVQVSAEEHAVSMVIHGPRKPIVYEILPDAPVGPVPV